MSFLNPNIIINQRRRRILSIQRNGRELLNDGVSNRNIHIRGPSLTNNVSNVDTLKRIKQLPPQNTTNEFANQLFCGSCFY